MLVHAQGAGGGGGSPNTISLPGWDTFASHQHAPVCRGMSLSLASPAHLVKLRRACSHVAGSGNLLANQRCMRGGRRRSTVPSSAALGWSAGCASHCLRTQAVHSLRAPTAKCALGGSGHQQVRRCKCTQRFMPSIGCHGQWPAHAACRQAGRQADGCTCCQHHDQGRTHTTAAGTHLRL